MVKDNNNNFKINEDVDNIRGSYFAKGDTYIDYDTIKTAGEVSSITEKLEKESFVILESQQNMDAKVKTTS